MVTGAASGLGLEFSHLLANDSFDLIMIDLDHAKLKEAKVIIEEKYKAAVQTLVFDLSKPQVAVEIYDVVKNRKVEILINNAGFGLFGFFSETDWKTEEEMIHLHVLTLTHLTKLILRDMLSRGKGRIMNVSSLAAFQPGPMMSIYYASKAFILSFSEALSNEVKGTGVTVTVLCPGLTKTNFQKKAAALSNSKESSVSFAKVSPQDVARYGYRAMMRGKRLAVPGLINKLTSRLPRFFPRSFTIAIVRRIQENLRK